MAGGAGLQEFRVVAAGLEGGTIGTYVPATALIPGITDAPSKEQRSKFRPSYLTGTKMPMRSTTSTFAFAPIPLKGLLGSENFGYILGMALKGGVVGVSDGGTPPAYLWTYTPTPGSEDLPDLRTLEIDDKAWGAGKGWVYPSAYGSNLGITGKIDEDVLFSSDLVAQKEIKNATIAALTMPTTFNPYPFSGLTKGSKSGLYIDDTGGTLGATLFPGCLRSFGFSVDTKRYHRCQSLYYTAIHDVPLNPKLTLEMEASGAAGDSLGFLTEYQNDTRVLVRLRFDGNQVIRTIANATTAPTLAASGTGNTLAAGNYFVKYVWRTETGATLPSTESTVQAVTSGQQLDITVPTFPVGATGWDAYITLVGGASGTETGPQNATPYTGTVAHFGVPVTAKSAPPTVNAATVNNYLQIDFAGQILDPSAIGSTNVDGVEVVTFSLESEVDAGLASGNVLSISGRNALAAFP